jgi:hypothetical protein
VRESRDALGLYRRLGRLATLLAVVCVAATGCVQRRLTIRSNPPGALVYVDDYEIGTTPVSTNFTYYGTRRIRLVKDGYETLTVMQTIPPPWYEMVPLDFVTENLIPGEIRDHRAFDYQLTPQAVVPTEQLLSRAEGLRAQTRVSGVVQSDLVPPQGPQMPRAAPATPSDGMVAPPSGGPGGTIPYPLEPPGGWRSFGPP